MPTASARLRRALDLIDPAFEAPGRKLLEHPRVGALYPQYLAATTHVTLAIVPLMETALERARAVAPDDQVAAGLADYLERHILEELHGEEPGRAALDDLEALGIDAADLLERLPPKSVAALIGTLACWIWQRHPVAILGFLQLEAYQPLPHKVEEMIERTGLPRDGFRQLLLHAELDVEHAEELHHLIDTLPLEPWHEQVITTSALQTFAFLIETWLGVLAAEAPVAVTGAR